MPHPWMTHVQDILVDAFEFCLRAERLRRRFGELGPGGKLWTYPKVNPRRTSTRSTTDTHQ